MSKKEEFVGDGDFYQKQSITVYMRRSPKYTQAVLSEIRKKIHLGKTAIV
jgi:hypothetical protein